MSFIIEGAGRYDIKYLENGKELHLHVDLADAIKLDLKSIKNWEKPYDKEEISLEEKQRILKNLYETFGECEDFEFDLSVEGNIVHCDEILRKLKFDFFLLDYSETKEHHLFNEMSEEFKNNLHGDIPYLYDCVNKLDKEEYKKFKEEIDINKNIQFLLIKFSKWKINEDLANIDNEKFQNGLCALDMALTDDNKEEIKTILLQYEKVAGEKILSFEEFMSKNSPLSNVIKEVRHKKDLKEGTTYTIQVTKPKDFLSPTGYKFFPARFYERTKDSEGQEYLLFILDEQFKMSDTGLKMVLMVMKYVQEEVSDIYYIPYEVELINQFKNIDSIKDKFQWILAGKVIDFKYKIDYIEVGKQYEVHNFLSVDVLGGGHVFTATAIDLSTDKNNNKYFLLKTNVTLAESHIEPKTKSLERNLVNYVVIKDKEIINNETDFDLYYIPDKLVQQFKTIDLSSLELVKISKATIKVI